MSEACKGKGHTLREVHAVAAYKCTKCDYHIRVNNISKTSLGTRECPRCKAEGSENVDCNFHGTHGMKYHCHNCGYEWIES